MLSFLTEFLNAMCPQDHILMSVDQTSDDLTFFIHFHVKQYSYPKCREFDLENK